jgi:hypothetical protein
MAFSERGQGNAAADGVCFGFCTRGAAAGEKGEQGAHYVDGSGVGPVSGWPASIPAFALTYVTSGIITLTRLKTA